jgi:hypothetical protein
VPELGREFSMPELGRELLVPELGREFSVPEVGREFSVPELGRELLVPEFGTSFFLLGPHSKKQHELLSLTTKTGLVLQFRILKPSPQYRYGCVEFLFNIYQLE